MNRSACRPALRKTLRFRSRTRIHVLSIRAGVTEEVAP